MYIISLGSCTGLVKCVCIIPILPTRNRELRRHWSSHYDIASRIWELGTESVIQVFCFKSSVFFFLKLSFKSLLLSMQIMCILSSSESFFVCSFSVVYFVYSWPLNNPGVGGTAPTTMQLKIQILLSLPQKQRNWQMTHPGAVSSHSLDSIRTQILVLLFPHIVVAN